MLVSVSLADLATWAGKNQKTIRRWCQRGHVFGARCSRGGHWRVRVSIRKPDLSRARRLARASGDFAGEVAGIVSEKAVDALRPPAGFERRKRRKPVMPAGWRAFSVATAERVAAVAEFAASRGGPPNYLLNRLPEIRAAGAWMVPVALGEDEELSPAHDAAIAGAQAGKPLFVAAFGAARMLLADSGRCSVASVCRKLGLSRASVYRRGQLAEIKGALAQARLEEITTRGGCVWAAQVGRLAGAGDTGRRVNTWHDVEKDGQLNAAG